MTNPEIQKPVPEKAVPEPNPNVIPEDPAPTDPEPTDPAATDPLLGSDSFIDPEQNDAAEEESAEKPAEEENPTVEFEPGTVIKATPISMVAPADVKSARKGKAKVGSKKTDPKAMAERPDWLPDGWVVDVKVRETGQTAGTIDRYYIEPTTQQKLRSKNEVFHWLETGCKLKSKKKSTSQADEPSGSAASGKRKRSSARSQNSEAAGSSSSSKGKASAKSTKSEPCDGSATPKEKKSRKKSKKSEEGEDVHDVEVRVVKDFTVKDGVVREIPEVKGDEEVNEASSK